MHWWIKFSVHLCASCQFQLHRKQVSCKHELKATLMLKMRCTATSSLATEIHLWFVAEKIAQLGHLKSISFCLHSVLRYGAFLWKMSTSIKWKGDLIGSEITIPIIKTFKEFFDILGNMICFFCREIRQPIPLSYPDGKYKASSISRLAGFRLHAKLRQPASGSSFKLPTRSDMRVVSIFSYNSRHERK